MSSFLTWGSPEIQTLLKREGGGEEELRVVPGTSTMSVFVKFRVSATADGEGRHQGHGRLSLLEDGVSGSGSTAAPIPVSMDTIWLG